MYEAADAEKICSKCGAAYKEDAVFCGRDGTLLSGVNAPKINELIAAGDRALTKDDHRKAAEYFREALGLDPSSVRASEGARKVEEFQEEKRLAGEFVFVKGGCFEMGDASGAGDPDERPLHEVCVNDFALGKYEVTQGQWERVMGSNPSRFKESDRHPVESISLEDAREFAERLGRVTGKKYRLPTEAEWEYACRNMGKNMKFPWGDSRPVCSAGAKNGAKFDDRGVCNGTGTEPVGRYAPNELGLYDMAGNVWEWVEDGYSGSAYERHSRTDPIHQGDGRLHVERGGSWANEARHQRCVERDFYDPRDRSSVLGFRIVREIAP